jgi:ABC-2 type transport system ATP-binding protein
MLGHPFGHAPTRRQVGFLAENVALYHRPAAKLLHFYGTLNGMRDPQLRSRTAEMLKEMDLQGAGQRSAGKFSRGMLQRLGLAEALMNDPQLLILDEPTSALDPIGRVHVREILLRARAAGKTIFLSSHQLSEVEHICDRVAIVVRGRLVRMGPLTQLLESQDQFMIIARGIDALMFGGTRQDGAIRVLVPALKQRETLEKIWVAGGEVIAVNPARRSLEELFVELAHQNGGADKPEGVQND